LAAEIRKAKGLEVELVKGSGGIFDVLDGEKMIFSKKVEHRFPEANEILDEL